MYRATTQLSDDNKSSNLKVTTIQNISFEPWMVLMLVLVGCDLNLYILVSVYVVHT